MRAIDTNVLVRLVARDDAQQVAAAEAFVANGAWVSHLVLAETMWVLSSVFKLNSAAIAIAIEMLLNHKQLVLENNEVVADALTHFRLRPSLGFSDCLVLEIAKHVGHSPLGTFDRDLSKVDGAQKL